MATVALALDDGVVKEACSMFLGTSAEFELALYTLLYFQHQSQSQSRRGEESNFDIRLDGVDICVTVVVNNSALITAFPRDV